LDFDKKKKVEVREKKPVPHYIRVSFLMTGDERTSLSIPTNRAPTMMINEKAGPPNHPSNKKPSLSFLPFLFFLPSFVLLPSSYKPYYYIHLYMHTRPVMSC
jgi:hypothetical protein